jgi:hypothetical protein
MLQILQRCFSFFRPARSAEAPLPTTVLLVRVPLGSKQPVRQSSPETLPPLDAPPVAAARVARQTPARRQTQHPGTAPADKTLRELGIFPPPVIRKLSRLGVPVVLEFLRADPNCLADRMGQRRYAAKLRRRQRAIRFARRFSEMTPLEALLLFATHRRSRAALAADSPAVLRRDLQRLLLSSAGQRLAGDRSAPDVARVRLWISEAKTQLNCQPKAYAGRAG